MTKQRDRLTRTVSRSTTRSPALGGLQAPARAFDVRDLLLFLVIVALILSIVLGNFSTGQDSGTPATGRDSGTPATNLLINNGTIPLQGVVIASLVFLTLVLGYVGYLVLTGRWRDLKRISPLFGVAGFFIVAGTVVRLYPFEWSDAISGAFVVIGYSLAVFFVIKEFQLLPWDRRAQKDDLERQIRDLSEKAAFDVERENNTLKVAAQEDKQRILRLRTETTQLYDWAQLARINGQEEVAKKMVSKILEKLEERRKAVNEIASKDRQDASIE